MQRMVGVACGVHAEHSDVQRMIRWNGVEPHQSGGDRDGAFFTNLEQRL